MNARFALLVTAAVSLACGGVPDVKGTLGATCGSAGGPVPSVDLAELAGPVDAAPGLVLEVTAEGFVIDGEETDTLQAFSEAQERASEIADAMGEEASGGVGVAIGADVTGSRVVEVLDGLAGLGVSDIRFLLRSPEPRAATAYLDPDYAADLRERAAEIEPSMRMTVLAAEVDSLLAACPGGQNAFAAVAHASPEMRCQLMVAGLEEALPSCPFTDGAAVVTALQVMFEPPPYDVVTLALTLDANAEPFEVPKDAAWSAIAPLWQPRSGQSARWVLEGAAAKPSSKPGPAGPKPAPTPARAASSASVGKIQASGPLDATLVTKVMARARAPVRACYEQSVARNPSTAGSMVLKVVVGADGRVSSAKAEDDTVGDAQLTSCLIASARKLRFPSSGGVTTVEMPLVFSAR
ncbi:MAG: AgmX/PglI C-terminal domain-containing protein [Alphaproteobacteria bacterium]|nr:AgmX/PglI C-terminal domain-containing protein [Alphaproteobacteria bacterium]